MWKLIFASHGQAGILSRCRVVQIFEGNPYRTELAPPTWHEELDVQGTLERCLESPCVNRCEIRCEWRIRAGPVIRTAINRSFILMVGYDVDALQ